MDSTKTLLITGGAGFIGSNYLNKFVPLYLDTKFVNIDSLTYAGSLDNIKVSESPNYVFEKADIRDRSKLEEIFSKYKPDGVIHFAAESHVDMSIKDPDIFVETNVLGTHNLLSLSKEHGIKRFHYVGTDEVYGSLSLSDTAWTEESLLLPRSPYSASKAGGEMMVRAYKETFGLDVTITRCSNNYGPYQDRTKLIPLFITKLLAGEKVPVYGKGDNIRDWLYVEDHVDAIDLVFRKGVNGEVYNIAGNSELTNLEITQKLIELTHRDESAIEYVTDRPGHDFRYALDASKIKNTLGFTPKVSLEDGLAKTLEFYKK
jgi:dTDP-glucose 4,6-dehydratase